MNGRPPIIVTAPLYVMGLLSFTRFMFGMSCLMGAIGSLNILIAFFKNPSFLALGVFFGMFSFFAVLAYWGLYPFCRAVRSALRAVASPIERVLRR